MAIDTSKVASNARLRVTYTGDEYIEKRYCDYSAFNNTLLVASREFVYDISKIWRDTATLFYNMGSSRIPVWFRPCEYEDSFFSFHPDNGSLLFTYMRGVDKEILDGERKVYISTAIAGLLKSPTILIQPAVSKSVQRF